MMTAEEKVDAVLMHHGIEGQKWGVRHGPPYPLDRKTSSEIKRSEEVKETDKKELNERTKRIVEDFWQWDKIPNNECYKNFMSEETYSKFKNFVEKAKSMDDTLSGRNVMIYHPESKDGLQASQWLWWSDNDIAGEERHDFTKEDGEKFKEICNKYEPSYDRGSYSVYGDPKFDKNNNLVGFTTTEEYKKEYAKEQRRDKIRQNFSKEYWESRYASYLDRKEKKKLQHSAFEYEIVDDVLEHHGIEGQKWGIKHGPPYPLDRKTSKAIKKSGKVTVNVKDLSDDDLRRIINRLQMEKQLKELTAADTKKAESYAKKSAAKLRDKLTDTAFDIISTSLKTISSYGLKKALEQGDKKGKAKK